MCRTCLQYITRVINQTAGYFMAPEGDERIGDVSNVVFSNGWIADEDGSVFIYYASSDTRIHVATSTVNRVLDYVMHTALDTFTSAGSLSTLHHRIDKNLLVNAAKNRHRDTSVGV